MKPLPLLLSMLCLLIPASAAAEDLERLRASYGAAVDRAVQPARESYERELSRLVDTRTRRSELEGALSARKVLQALSAASAGGEDGDGPTGDTELDRLRATYEEAAERVVRPLRETYLRELDKIVQARTRNSDLQGTLAAKAELDRAAEERDRSLADPLEALFVGQTWVSAAGTAFTFEKDGICIRQSGERKEGAWRRRGNVVVSSVEGSPQETRYFRFVSKTEAYYGNSDKTMNLPVTRR